MKFIEHRWMFAPIVLLGGTVVIGVATVLSAVAGHPLGMEPAYDTKAASWDEEREQRAQNDRLRWVVTPELRSDGAHRTLVVRVEDKHAARIAADRVVIECIPNLLDASRRMLQLTAVPQESGVFEGSFDCTVGGLWEFRVTVETPLGRYTDVFRRQLPHAPVMTRSSGSGTHWYRDESRGST
jgi:hypothetical protein